MRRAAEAHYNAVAKAVRDGRVVPFLGAGVNLVGRPGDAAFETGRYLPSSTDLARHLATYFDYPPGDVLDLVRVSQYASIMTGSGPLYETLHEVFDADYPPTLLHEFLASLPRMLREQRTPRHQLIVTTNYDDALETAFRRADEPFDLVSYIADGEDRGKFLHIPPDGEARIIERPNEYDQLSLDVRTVIAKIHGAVDRANPDGDSYVITEDHYIDYLTRSDIAQLVPATLQAKLRRSHFLFLGYSLRDWNLRVILHRIWGAQKLKFNSWSVQLQSDPVDEEAWQQRNVKIINVRLEEYVEGLSRAIRDLAAQGVRP